MRVLIDDIEVAYHALKPTGSRTSRRRRPRIGAGPGADPAASSADVAGELAYWQSLPAASATLLPIEVDGSAGRVANCATVRRGSPRIGGIATAA